VPLRALPRPARCGRRAAACRGAGAPRAPRARAHAPRTPRTRTRRHSAHAGRGGAYTKVHPCELRVRNTRPAALARAPAPPAGRGPDRRRAAAARATADATPGRAQRGLLSGPVPCPAPPRAGPGAAAGARGARGAPGVSSLASRAPMRLIYTPQLFTRTSDYLLSDGTAECCASGCAEGGAGRNPYLS
jgi:hypothetical protein